MGALQRPGRLICHGCNDDLGTTGYDEEVEAWLYECPTCEGVDGPLMLELRTGGRGGRSPRAGNGIMAELGVYDGILEALGQRPGQWLEFAVVEHLYAQVDHAEYQELVDRYGHVAIEPDTNTASWMLGRAAWALRGENEIKTRRMKRGTGRWGYLSPGHAWALPTTGESVETLTWEAFAQAEGFSPRSHPAIDWRETPNAAPA